MQERRKLLIFQVYLFKRVYGYVVVRFRQLCGLAAPEMEGGAPHPASKSS